MRDAVWTLIGEDMILSSQFGISTDVVFPTYALDGSRTPPKNADGYFIILRWEEEAVSGPGVRTVLSVWVHRSRSAGSDFTPIRNILKRIIRIMVDTVHRSGADGVMTQAFFKGMGGDQVDQGYDTITKYAVFDVLGGENLTG